MTDSIRALTNLDADAERERIYVQAADNTGFPCWVEHYPMPRGAGDFSPGSAGSHILRALDLMCGELEDHYDPNRCQELWSLWTEWGDRNHSRFWDEVKRLEGEKNP